MRLLRCSGWLRSGQKSPPQSIPDSEYSQESPAYWYQLPYGHKLYTISPKSSERESEALFSGDSTGSCQQRCIYCFHLVYMRFEWVSFDNFCLDFITLYKTSLLWNTIRMSTIEWTDPLLRSERERNGEGSIAVISKWEVSLNEGLKQCE